MNTTYIAALVFTALALPVLFSLTRALERRTTRRGRVSLVLIIGAVVGALLGLAIGATPAAAAVGASFAFLAVASFLVVLFGAKMGPEA